MDEKVYKYDKQYGVLFLKADTIGLLLPWVRIVMLSQGLGSSSFSHWGSQLATHEGRKKM